MSYIKALDVSRWQGSIDWNAVKGAGYEIAIIKMSGGDAGLYYDSKATVNYNGAIAAGIAVGGYHFAGAGDANAEAEYFVRSMSPLAENDVLVLDWEVAHADPVGWCAAFVNRVHDLTGIWCIVYMNGSTFNAYNWNGNSAIANCGKWIAWYGRDPNADLPLGGKVYVMHQYTSTGAVPGIAGNVDLDAWYGTVAAFKKYGWHAAPAPTPTPDPTPPVHVPVVSVETVTTTESVPFEKTTIQDPNINEGTTSYTQAGIDGVRTKTYTVTLTDGVETARVLASDVVTQAPVTEVTTVGTKPVVVPDPDPEPTPDPTPTPTQSNWKALVGAVITAIAALIVAIAAWVK